MGYLGALAFADAAPRRVALSWHLTANHYPPLPESLIDPCERAIELALAGDWDATVDCSEVDEIGIRIAPYSDEITTTPTVSRLVEICHLGAFLDCEDSRVDVADDENSDDYDYDGAPPLGRTDGEA